VHDPAVQSNSSINAILHLELKLDFANLSVVCSQSLTSMKAPMEQCIFVIMKQTSKVAITEFNSNKNITKFK